MSAIREGISTASRSHLKQMIPAEKMKLFIIAAVIACAWADKVPFKDCGSTDGKITSVNVSGCKAFPCQLPHNKNVTVAVEFTSNVQTSTATAVVHGVIMGVPIAFPIPQQDGCKSGLTCPVAAKSTQTYTSSIFVSPKYPKLKLVVKWELKDDAKNDLFCFVVPAEITD